MAQIKGGLQQARVDVENLERTQKALEELVAKQAATQRRTRAEPSGA